jgi:amidase
VADRGTGQLKEFRPEDLKFLYSSDHDPIGSVAPGERFIVETEDCFTGRYRDPSGFTPENNAWIDRNLDGVTGPIYVDRAEPDDIVAVTLHDIEVTTRGSVALSPCSAPSPSDWWGQWYACKSYEVEHGHLVLDSGARIPIRPLIGCIAVAPDREAVLSRMQGPYGGNMDSNDVTIGATVLLPVFTPGAYLYFGDAKAIMGDGEVTQPPEVGTRITVSVEVSARPRTMRWPRVISASALTTVVSANSIDRAAQLAFAELLNWIDDDSPMDRDEIALLLGMVANTGICQIANTQATARCTVTRASLQAVGLTP